MIGFLIGTACLIGLISTLRRGGGCGGGYRYGGGHHGWGGCHREGRRGWYDGHDGPPDPWQRRGASDDGDFRRAARDDDRFDGPPGGFGAGFGREVGRGFGRGFGKRWFLRGLFDRLRTTPEQERSIVDALDEASEQRAKIRQEMKASRKDIARAVSGNSVEETILGEVFSRHDTVIEEMRKALVAALVKIHAVLDDKQRAQLGEIVEGGWFARF